MRSGDTMEELQAGNVDREVWVGTRPGLDHRGVAAASGATGSIHAQRGCAGLATRLGDFAQKSEAITVPSTPSPGPRPDEVSPHFASSAPSHRLGLRAFMRASPGRLSSGISSESSSKPTKDTLGVTKLTCLTYSWAVLMQEVYGLMPRILGCFGRRLTLARCWL